MSRARLFTVLANSSQVIGYGKLVDVSSHMHTSRIAYHENSLDQPFVLPAIPMISRSYFEEKCVDGSQQLSYSISTGAFVLYSICVSKHLLVSKQQTDSFAARQ